jgi:hypothetical protein
VGGVKTKRFGELKKFDNINATLPAFEPSDIGLILANPASKISLRHPRCLSLCDE